MLILLSKTFIGQEYVDNIFYNLNNDYEMVTLNRSVWDVWKTPINAKYNYWGYNESVAVAGRIKGIQNVTIDLFSYF